MRPRRPVRWGRRRLRVCSKHDGAAHRAGADTPAEGADTPAAPRDGGNEAHDAPSVTAMRARTRRRLRVGIASMGGCNRGAPAWSEGPSGRERNRQGARLQSTAAGRGHQRERPTGNHGGTKLGTPRSRRESKRVKGKKGEPREHEKAREVPVGHREPEGWDWVYQGRAPTMRAHVGDTRNLGAGLGLGAGTPAALGRHLGPPFETGHAGRPGEREQPSRTGEAPRADGRDWVHVESYRR